MDNYPNFNRLKIVTRWAGFIGLVQSLIWLGLSIVGIVHYHYSVTDYKTEITNFGTITPIIFYKLYFHGEADNLPSSIDYTILSSEDVQTTLNSDQIYVWVWVYLVSSVLWFFSSMALIMKIKKTNLRTVKTLLYIWIFITLYTSGMDLALSIIFGLDFDKFNMKTYDIPLDDNPKQLDGVILLAAKVSSIIMMIMAARGFILWLINVAFMAYFFNETFTIIIEDSSIYMNRELFPPDAHSISNRAPIKAYDTINNHVLSKGENNRGHSIKLNTAAIERASRISNAVLEDRNMDGCRFNRGFSSFEQYPKIDNEPKFPEPDYTPPMPRANPFVIPPLRKIGPQDYKNKRYF